ncbi:MAG TPA: DUF5664 domain-containing protein [Candidatus Absconditabacterales bacterium]|nr:DUF5664 domain-containing protein [Candidatus Absconditabacterales bacterium]
MAEGIKFDKGKSNVELIPGEVLLKVGIILGFGKEKYGKNSWQNLDNFEDRYLGAALRHIYQHQSGEIFDSESGQTHLGHALTNLIFLVYKQIQDEKDGKLGNELFKNSGEDSK